MSDTKGLVTILCTVLFLAFAGFWGIPNYSIYMNARAGEAELRKAEYSKQVAVQEAIATLESSKLKAQAEIERAKGVAEANKIIGESLRGNEVYLHYLWIHQLEQTKNQVIYIPTEANMPILEAGRVGTAVEKH